jgi:N6-adenosine-specific RNA methylase IME4
MAMEVYARQAKDGELVGYAVEIKKRATRRLGEIMEENRKAGKLAKGTRGRLPAGPGRGRKRRGAVNPTVLEITLDKQGIDKNLAKLARKEAAKSEGKFEADVARARGMAVAAAEGNKAIVTEARAERHREKRNRRTKRERELAAKLAALPKKRYAVIVADPEWRFEFYSEKGKTNSSADNHYLTSALALIKTRDVPSISADDCVLFLWATVPMLPQALEVMEAWGFNYKSNFIWNKNKTGTGYWNRNKHEHLLIGTRGKIPAPADGDQWPSVIDAPVGQHSEKPEKFLEMVEAYFPTLPKIELNRRGPARSGWDAWGNEAE